jgi:hypothetical protein
VIRTFQAAELRRLLQERYPEHSLPPAQVWKSGWDLLDEKRGGLPQGAVVELVSAIGCSGLFLDRILAANSFAALIDCRCAFDPNSYPAEQLNHLLCVFAENVEMAVKAADLLLRDGNLAVVLLDLQFAPRRSLARIASSAWHRLQRLVEKSGTAFVVFTSQPIIDAARFRIVMRNSWDLPALRQRRSDLLEEIDLQMFSRADAPPDLFVNNGR